MSAPQHWSIEYLNKPWAVGGRGPDAFDCFGLLAAVLKKHKGLEVPLYTEIHSRDALATMRAMKHAPELAEWVTVKKPFEFCPVGLSQHLEFHHVGIFTEADGGLVLHCSDMKRVCLASVARLRSEGFGRIEFFAHRSWLT